MHDVLAWLEASALGAFMRDSGPWTYAVANVLHVLGVATLFGAVLILDLRLIGLWRRTPLNAIAIAASPVAMAGFALAIASGACLLASNAVAYESNPFLLTKFAAIGLGVLNAVLLRLTPAWRTRAVGELSRREARWLALVGGVSLVSWMVAITAGRMIGYW